ncbi:unnamed protein product [Phaedon cochleariae]|uniref:Dihydrolipoamide acetyltransferase component of pyruvate dehydrogenase complex n=1 Tax=Phaedon cochleariae TaxID=80249 RepID=A0A9P0DP00_PHACE|nr:unnamed protein product [Phaedon cochleariae]
MYPSNKIIQTLTRFLKGTNLNARKKLHIHHNLAARVAFNLSDIGEGIKEVVVKEWYVKVGDKVSQFDNICEVQSDKASVTITSRYDGAIAKLHYEVDGIALVGKPLVDIETDDVQEVVNVDVPKQQVSESVPQDVETKIEKEEVNTAPDSNEALSIPSVRRLAKEHNLDLAQIPGTGKNGRILKEDVLKFMEQLATPAKIAPAGDRIEPIKGFKRAMVKTMTESMKIPHFVYSDEITVTELSKVRNILKNAHQTKISFVPFFIKAVSNALHHFPILNASVDVTCDNILYHDSHNIGVAMDTAVGLAVPVIKNVAALTIVEIDRELQRLIKTGKTGNFSPGDLSGCTFSVSNIGSIGGTYMKPLILPPQVAILAVGSSQVLPRFDELGNVKGEEILNVSGSADHRVIDGATMARFVKALKRQLENPYLLFLNL